jgi:hypothetical protein
LRFVAPVLAKPVLKLLETSDQAERTTLVSRERGDVTPLNWAMRSGSAGPISCVRI